MKHVEFHKVLFFVLSCWVVFAQSDNHPLPIWNMKSPWAQENINVFKSMYYSDGCTAFAISPKFIFSAGHCGIPTTLTRYWDDKAIAFEVRLLFSLEDVSNFAIYEAKEEIQNYIQPNFKLLNINQINSEETFTLGFPSQQQSNDSNSVLFLSHVKNIDYEGSKMFSMRAEEEIKSPRYIKYNPLGNDVILSFTSDIDGGNSGGPLILKEKDSLQSSGVAYGVIVGGTSLFDSKFQNSKAYAFHSIARYIQTFDPELAQELSIVDVKPYLLNAKMFTNKFGSIVSNHLRLKDVNFSDAELYISSPDCVFENVTFNYGVLLGADLSKCIFKNVTFNKTLYTKLTRFPESFSLPVKGLVGPIPDSISGVKVENVDLSNRNLDQIVFPDRIRFESINFSNSSMKNTYFASSVRKIILNNTNLSSSNFFLRFSGSIDIQSKINLKDSFFDLGGDRVINPNELIMSENSIGEYSVKSDYEYFNLRTNKNEYFNEKKFVYGSGPNIPGNAFIFTSDSVLEEHQPMLEPFKRAMLSVGPKPWSEEEKEEIKSTLALWQEQFPTIMRRISKFNIVFKRQKDFGKIIQRAPYVVKNELDVMVSSPYIKRGVNDFPLSVDITFADSGLEKFKLNGVEKYKFVLMHALLKAIYKFKRFPIHSDSEYPLYDQFVRCNVKSHIYQEIEDAKATYLDLRKNGGEETAMHYGYDFAKKYNLPSIQSMRCNSDVLNAEVFAYGLLDPQASSYLPDQLNHDFQKWFNFSMK